MGLLAGCGRDTPGLAPLGGEAVILAFGDSLTYGTGAREGESYPEQLAKLIGFKVVRAGVPGELSAQGLRRLPRMLEEYDPDLLILCHGGNDILRKKGLAATKQNIKDMIQTARDAGAEVVLIGVPSFGLSLRTAAIYTELAAEMKVPIEDEVIGDILGDNRLKSDGVHPNAAGYQALAKAVAELLVDNGAISEFSN